MIISPAAWISCCFTTRSTVQPASSSKRRICQGICLQRQSSWPPARWWPLENSRGLFCAVARRGDHAGSPGLILPLTSICAKIKIIFQASIRTPCQFCPSRATSFHHLGLGRPRASCGVTLPGVGTSCTEGSSPDRASVSGRSIKGLHCRA